MEKNVGFYERSKESLADANHNLLCDFNTKRINRQINLIPYASSGMCSGFEGCSGVSFTEHRKLQTLKVRD